MGDIYISEVKSKAKQALSGRLGVAICALLLLQIVGNIGNYINRYFSTMYSVMHPVKVESNPKTFEDVMKMYSDMLQQGYQTPAWLWAVMIICSLIAMPMIVGCAKLFIGLTRGRDMELSVIFEPYKNAPKIVGLNLYVGILVFLQTLLFIIPGIIAAYRYALVNYIVAEDEDISITDAVKMSKELMQGHKFKLFTLQLSFIGWFILSLFSCGILWIAYVNPYYNAAMAEFYNEVSGKTFEIKEDPMADDSDNTWGDGGNLY